MSSKEVCRVGDTVTGTCKVSASGHPRSFTGTWTTGSSHVTVLGIGLVRKSDTGTTDCGHTFSGNTSNNVSGEGGVAFMRVGDATVGPNGGTGVCTTGSGSVTSL